MRLWSLHPKYLDTRGLVALWREALLAQAVLKGETHGNTHHPQLIRFRESSSPLATIAFYLHEIHAEATRRGYCFDAGKIGQFDTVEQIAVTRGQLDYEWSHLKAKLKLRDPARLAQLQQLSRPSGRPGCRLGSGQRHQVFLTNILCASVFCNFGTSVLGAWISAMLAHVRAQTLLGFP